MFCVLQIVLHQKNKETFAIRLANTTAEFEGELNSPLERFKAIHQARFTGIDLVFFAECKPDSVYLRDDHVLPFMETPNMGEVVRVLLMGDIYL